jgi:Protein of unknown function (DUF1419)
MSLYISILSTQLRIFDSVSNKPRDVMVSTGMARGPQNHAVFPRHGQRIENLSAWEKYQGHWFTITMRYYNALLQRIKAR